MTTLHKQLWVIEQLIGKELAEMQAFLPARLTKLTHAVNTVMGAVNAPDFDLNSCPDTDYFHIHVAQAVHYALHKGLPQLSKPKKRYEMPQQVERGLEWCKALYLKGYVGQAHAIMTKAITSHDPTTAKELQDAWFAFLESV